VRRETVKFTACVVGVLAILAAVIICSGCASPPLQTTGDGPASAGGEARSETSKVNTTPAVAFAQPGGTSSARSVTAGVERQNQNTASGESIIGVAFPGSTAYMSAMASDPVILSLSKRINDETEKEAPDDELLARLYDQFTENADRIREALKATCPDFGGLKVVNVMVLVCKDNGAAEGETGDVQSQAVAEAMAKVVEATVKDDGPGS